MKILVVDDRQEQKDAARFLLHEHEVVFADGSDAFNFFSKGNPNQVDVVLANIILPHIWPWENAHPVIAYGYPIALQALSFGVKKVALISPEDHPLTGISRVMDGFFLDGQLLVDARGNTLSMCEELDDVEQQSAESLKFLHGETFDCTNWRRILSRLLESKKGGS